MLTTYTPDSREPFEITNDDIFRILCAFAENDGCEVLVIDMQVSDAKISAGEKSCWFRFAEIADFVAEYIDETHPEMRETLIRDEWAFNPLNVTPEIAREILAF